MLLLDVQMSSVVALLLSSFVLASTQPDDRKFLLLFQFTKENGSFFSTVDTVVDENILLI